MATGMQGETIWAADANSTNVGLFLFAKMVAGNKFDVAAANDAVLGVFIEVNGTSGPASVQLDRVGKVTVGASAVAAGIRLSSDANGKAVAYSSGNTAGIALSDGNPGDIIPVKLS